MGFLGGLAGCRHMSGGHENQFEIVADHDVVPEPVDHHTPAASIKDTGVVFGLSEEFASQETLSWRTRVTHAIRGTISAQEGNWDTDYTHSSKDLIASPSYERSPVEIYRRTGQWPRRYTLDTGDRLRVIVYSQRTLTRSYRVDDSGRISVPLVGTLKVRGATTRQVTARIKAALRKKYLRDPKVSVEVATYRPLFVLGQVQQAGQYPFVVGMTAEMAVAVAGGYSPRADERKFRVSRVYKGRRYTLHVTKNFPIFPGDTVYVRERFF